MIRAVKDEVLEKLKMKRISVDKMTARPVKTSMGKESTEQGQANTQETTFKNKNHLQILEMLEEFEHTSP